MTKRRLETNLYVTYLLEGKAVLEPGTGFGHEAGGVHTAVPQAAALGEMSLEFLPVSPVGGEGVCGWRWGERQREVVIL